MLPPTPTNYSTFHYKENISKINCFEGVCFDALKQVAQLSCTSEITKYTHTQLSSLNIPPKRQPMN